MLRNCLASIPKGQGNLSLQVIVVDNASSDGSAEMVEKDFPHYELIRSGGNLGFAKGNNLARNRARSDLVLFLNPDTILLDHSLETMVEFMRGHGDIGALGCKMRYLDGQVQEQGLQHFPTPMWQLLTALFLTTETWTSFRSFLPYLDPHQSSYVKKLYGGCLLCHKGLLDEVGWFDERYFMYAEDVDLCQTILNRGYKLYYLAEAEIIHIAGGSSKKAPSGFAILMKSESCCKLMRKYYGRFGAFVYRLSIVLGSVFRIFFLLMAGIFSFVPVVRRKVHFRDSFMKHWLLLKWAFGLKHATVARSRTAPVQLEMARV